MAEAGLVSWDAPEKLGKLPGSDWVCPRGSLDKLGAFERDGGMVTDQMIIELAHGRPQHLELLQFPEGFQAAQIIDSNTGASLTDFPSAQRYDGLLGAFICSCGVWRAEPTRASLLEDSPLDLGGGKQLVDVHSLHGKLQTLIKPYEGPPSTPDYLSRVHTAARLTPASLSLHMEVEGEVASLGAQGRLAIKEEFSKPSADLTIAANDGSRVTGQLNIQLGPDGQIRAIKTFRSYRRLIPIAGINIDPDLNPYTEWSDVTNRHEQDLIMGATAEALGLGPWKGLDLSLTGAGLYAAIGRRQLDPFSVLVPFS